MTLLLACAAVGGAAGSVARYALGRLAASLGRPAHYATLFINGTGALLLGLMAGADWDVTRHAAYILLGAGFIGGFTTFSTLNVQLVGMLLRRSHTQAASYFLLTYGLGIPLAAAGFWLARLHIL